MAKKTAKKKTAAKKPLKKKTMKKTRGGGSKFEKPVLGYTLIEL